MDAACRLRVIAWLFVVLGIDGAIEQIVSLFRPIEFDSVCSLLPGLNVQILALPVGIGLHRRNALAHRIAVVRAVAHNAGIVLFDYANVALDL